MLLWITQSTCESPDARDTSSDTFKLWILDANPACLLVQVADPCTVLVANSPFRRMHIQPKSWVHVRAMDIDGSLHLIPFSSHIEGDGSESWVGIACSRWFTCWLSWSWSCHRCGYNLHDMYFSSFHLHASQADFNWCLQAVGHEGLFSLFSPAYLQAEYAVCIVSKWETLGPV